MEAEYKKYVVNKHHKLLEASQKHGQAHADRLLKALLGIEMCNPDLPKHFKHGVSSKVAANYQVLNRLSNA